MPEPSGQRGLFFNKLDSQQTSERRKGKATRSRVRRSPGEKDFDKKAEREAWRTVPALPLESGFRHSGWMLERLRVQHALLVANVAASRLERFKECGGDCVCEYSPSLRRYRLRANYCGDRFCIPCARARSRKIEGALVKAFSGSKPLFLTLTLRASRATLSACLDRLYASFKALRRDAVWKSAVRGGVAVTEIKRGSGSGQWHVHLHALLQADYLDARWLSERWKEITGDSFIVDVSRMKHQQEGIGYVAKYASKGWTAEVTRDHDSLVECVCSLRGRRLLVTFGRMAKLDVDSGTPRAEDWRRVDRLERILEAHGRGERWASGIVRGLMGADEEAKPLAFQSKGDPPGAEIPA